MKKHIALIVLALATMLLLLNFMPKATKEVSVGPKTQQPIKIVFKSSWAGVDSKANALQEIIKAFNTENPAIQVIDTSFSGEDFLYSLKTDFAMNQPPDVFGLWPGSDLDILIEKGMVADLKDVWQDDETWRTSFDQGVVDRYFSKDHLYSIPYEMIYEGLFVNKAIFDQYDIALPIDLNGMFTAVEALRGKGIIPIAFNVSPEGSFILQNYTAAIGGEIIQTDEQKRYDALGEAMKVLMALYHKGAFPQNCFTLDDYSRNQLFLTGKAAMIFQGSWFIDDNLEKLGQVDVLFAPSQKKHHKTILYGIGNGNFQVSQNAFDDPQKREAALLFLKYLTGPKGEQVFSKIPGFTSSLVQVEPLANPLKKAGLALVNQSKERVIPIDHLIDRKVWEEDIVAAIPQLFLKKIDVDTWLDQLRRR